tara:strand:+ start:7452 stop:8459 length:1008 start_codon:yes stop_codon:yes gene_type:complete
MKIEKLKKKSYKSIINYLDKYYKKNHIFKKSKKLFDWQYLSKKNYNFYLLKKASKIKAILGYIPTDLYDKELRNDTSFLSLWSSSEIKSGSRLYFHFLNKEKYNLIAGLGSSDQSLKFQKMLKWNVGYLKHFFITSNKKKKLIYPEYFSNFKDFKNKNNFLKLNSAHKILKLSKSLFNYQVPKKSPKFLINRYLNHPFYKYEIYAIKNKKVKGVFVIRKCYHKRNCAIRIVDYIGSNSNFSHGKYLFTYLLKKNSADFIDIYCYGVPIKNLNLSGMENINNYKNKIIIPNYFEPYLKKNINLPYAFTTKGRLKKKIRFFKGDSDLDRPNIITNKY